MSPFVVPSGRVAPDVLLIVPGWRMKDGQWVYVDMVGTEWRFPEPAEEPST